MAEYGWRQRLKGAVGNAIVFAAGWTVLGFFGWLSLRTIQIVPPLSMLDGLGMAIRIGFMGGLVGAFFPSIMRLFYRGKRLSEISALKFGAVGAVVVGLFVPAFMMGMNLLSGDTVPFALIRGDIVYSALFGGLAAGFSLRLAQYADKLFPESFQQHLDRLEKMTELTEGEAGMRAFGRDRQYAKVPRDDR